MNAAGVPEWRPPSWIDPQRRVRVNHRILARLFSRDQGTLVDEAESWFETGPPTPPVEPAGREGVLDAAGSDERLGADGPDGRRWDSSGGCTMSQEPAAPEEANAAGWDAPDRWLTPDEGQASDGRPASDRGEAFDGSDAPDAWDGAAYWGDADADADAYPDQALEEPSNWEGWTRADTEALHQVWLAWDEEQAGAGSR